MARETSHLSWAKWRQVYFMLDHMHWPVGISVWPAFLPFHEQSGGRCTLCLITCVGLWGSQSDLLSSPFMSKVEAGVLYAWSHALACGDLSLTYFPPLSWAKWRQVYFTLDHMRWPVGISVWPTFLPFHEQSGGRCTLCLITCVGLWGSQSDLLSSPFMSKVEAGVLYAWSHALACGDLSLTYFPPRCKSFISWRATYRCGSSWRTRDATCIRWSAPSTSRRRCWSPFRLLLTSLTHGRSWTGNAWIWTPSEWPLPWETAPFKTMVRQTLVFAFPCKWTAPCQRPSLFWHPVCASLSLYNFCQNKPVNKDLVLRLYLYQFCCFHEKLNNHSQRTTENTPLLRLQRFGSGLFFRRFNVITQDAYGNRSD